MEGLVSATKSDVANSFGRWYIAFFSYTERWTWGLKRPRVFLRTVRVIELKDNMHDSWSLSRDFYCLKLFFIIKVGTLFNSIRVYKSRSLVLRTYMLLKNERKMFPKVYAHMHACNPSLLIQTLLARSRSRSSLLIMHACMHYHSKYVLKSKPNANFLHIYMLLVFPCILIMILFLAVDIAPCRSRSYVDS